ncbi:hypothetical protein SEVIR_8G200200v4 [Setaria viridis]|uniref:BTB domain-containing protein n=1 Tax=Setaria viridis TaxID=4556 RepID=A0A4U6TLA2_SETVI|nr:BTB/POZ and MATH domain-containing protein 1-like [Setaria viridis]TKW01763.1 hypothetical protein SEVIR_8G200200v2 [Setaria viridis]
MASEHHLIEIAASQIGCQMSFRRSCWSSNIGGCRCECDYTTNSSAGTVSLILCLSSGNTRAPLNARFKFSLLDREVRPVPCRTRACSFQNWSPHEGWEWVCSDFITREDLDRQKYLDDGSFTVSCDIAIKPFTAKATDAFVTVPPSDLHQHLGNLLACEDGTDVTFKVAGGGGTGTFSAHRCVLAARSPVFRAQLFGEMKEGKEAATGGVVIAVDDMEAHVFRSLLHFVYTDSLTETDEELEQHDGDGYMMTAHYKDLLVAADRYGLERMKLICQEKLCRRIRADSVARMLALADRHHCPGLKEACFDFLSSSTNLEEFIETDGFEELTDTCPAVLKGLLDKLATVLIFE